MSYVVAHVIGVLFIYLVFAFPRWFFETTAVSISKSLDKGDYAAIVAKAKRLYRFVKIQTSILSESEKCRHRADFCLVFLCVSFFAQKDYENFQKHLRLIKEEKQSKEFWFTLSDLVVAEDPISAKAHYQDYLALSPNYSPHYLTLIDALFLYTEGKTEEARPMLEDAKKHIQLSVLKQVACEYLLEYPSSKERNN